MFLLSICLCIYSFDQKSFVIRWNQVCLVLNNLIKKDWLYYFVPNRSAVKNSYTGGNFSNYKISIPVQITFRQELKQTNQKQSVYSNMCILKIMFEVVGNNIGSIDSLQTTLFPFQVQKRSRILRRSERQDTQFFKRIIEPCFIQIQQPSETRFGSCQRIHFLHCFRNIKQCCGENYLKNNKCVPANCMIFFCYGSQTL